MTNAGLYAKGQNGQVHFDGQFVTITREGFLARVLVGKGEKRFPVHQISAVQLKPAGITRGYIQFTVPGGVELRSRFGRQTADAARDENSVVFLPGQEPAFMALRAAVEAAMVPSPSVPAGGVADELRKLAELRDAGVLTAEEFAARKARLLGSA